MRLTCLERAGQAAGSAPPRIDQLRANAFTDSAYSNHHPAGARPGKCPDAPPNPNLRADPKAARECRRRYRQSSAATLPVPARKAISVTGLGRAFRSSDRCDAPTIAQPRSFIPRGRRFHRALPPCSVLLRPDPAPTPVFYFFAQFAEAGCMKMIGTSTGSSNVTISHADSFASNARRSLLFNACPDLYPLNAPMRLWPSK